MCIRDRVGRALLTTFEQYLQEKWTSDVKQAWVGAYGAISEIMLDGADYSQAEISLPEDSEAGLPVDLLEQSFEEVKPQADAFVNSFYENLFTANPEAKPLFEHTNMASQKKMLLNSLVMVVENLRKPDALDKALRGLGARHVKYGALPEHYPLVGGALLTTFEQYLQEKWTPDVKQAWVGAYGTISDIMLDGADYSQAEVALKPEQRNTSIYTPDAQLMSNMVGNTPTSESLSYDSGKATIYALLGGGAMGLIATALAMLL